MHVRRKMATWAALPIAIVVLLIATSAFAQAQNQGDVPFLPKGFSSPDEFFEKMFGQSTAEEEKALQAIQIPIEDEREFGRPQVEAFLTNLQQQRVRLIRKGKDLDYVRKLVETIRPLMKDPNRYPQLTIYVVDSPRVDARTFPGGTLFFFKGLLNFAENEAAVAGIVGHELSHLDRGHLLLPLKRAKLMQQATTPGEFDPQKFFAAGTTMMRLSSRPFRPEDESAADRDGAKWAWQAGYDPREMARLFDSLHQRDRGPKLPFGAMFRTHPYSDDRRDAILKHYDELQQKDPRDTLYRGKENLAQRIPKSQQEFAE